MLFFNKRLKEALAEMEKRQRDLPEDSRREFQKGDGLALFLAVCISVLPFILLFVGAIYLVLWLFVGRFA